ncbi:MAG: signal peptidase I [Dehalococcoidia bacterium]
MTDLISAPERAPDEPLFQPLPISTHEGLSDLDPWAPPRGRSWLRALWPWGLAQVSETLEVIALAIVMFVAVRAVAQNFIVDGASMVPSFHNGELLIVNRLAYRTFDLSWIPGAGLDEWQPFGQAEIGDVIVFKFPRDPSRDFIKRVVALPGQTVEVRGGTVYVDGQALTEPYISDLPAYEFGPETVPAGQLFVLGDNRNNSYDSHSWGMLDQSLVIGRADLRYWPMSEIGRITHDEPMAELALTDTAAPRSAGALP